MCTWRQKQKCYLFRHFKTVPLCLSLDLESALPNLCNSSSNRRSDHFCMTVLVSLGLGGDECGGKLLYCCQLEPKCEDMGEKGNPVNTNSFPIS